MLTHHDRRDLMIEARFLPDSIEQAQELRELVREVVAAGEVDGIAPSQAEAYADQVTGWLIGKREGVDGRGAPTRSKYRKILAALEQRAGGDGERGSVRGIAQVLAAGVLAAAPIIYVM